MDTFNLEISFSKLKVGIFSTSLTGISFFSFSFLVPALVFGGFDFLYWETEGGFCRFAQFVYFYEGVLAEKRLYKEEEEVLSLMIGLGQKSST